MDVAAVLQRNERCGHDVSSHRSEQTGIAWATQLGRALRAAVTAGGSGAHLEVQRDRKKKTRWGHVATQPWDRQENASSP